MATNRRVEGRCSSKQVTSAVHHSPFEASRRDLSGSDRSSIHFVHVPLHRRCETGEGDVSTPNAAKQTIFSSPAYSLLNNLRFPSVIHISFRQHPAAASIPLSLLGPLLGRMRRPFVGWDGDVASRVRWAIVCGREKGKRSATELSFVSGQLIDGRRNEETSVAMGANGKAWEQAAHRGWGGEDGKCSREGAWAD